MTANRPRIALLFGSFNPVHLGHTILANYVVEFESMDETWLVVSPHNPLKEQNSLLDANVRLQLAETAVADSPHLKVCDIEFSLPKPSYTIQTLVELRRLHPDKEFYLLIGSDNWTIFPKWKEYRHIIDEFPIMIYPRKGDPILPETIVKRSIRTIEAPEIEISSTFIRKAYEQGANPSFLLPESVAVMIRKHNLYQHKLH